MQTLYATTICNTYMPLQYATKQCNKAMQLLYAAMGRVIKIFIMKSQNKYPRRGICNRTT